MDPVDVGVDENRSVWMIGHEGYEPCAPLVGDTTADVVIVGGGFAGVSTAWHLSLRYPHRRVVLLEARELASGASGRNGGQALNWVNGVGFDDPELVRAIWEATRGGIDWIADTIREHRLPVRWRREGALELYTDAARAEAAHAHVEKLRGWGIPVEYLQGAELTARVRLSGAQGAIFDPTAGVLNGVDLLRAMRPILLARGVVIHERTPAVSITEGSTIEVRTPQGSVRARAMVLAAGGYTPNLGYFTNELLPLHSHALAVAPPSGETWDELGWSLPGGLCDDLDRIAYGARTPDDHMVFGGGSNAAYTYLYGGRTWMAPDERLTRRGHEAVHRTLTTYMPGVARLPVTHRWTGTLGITFNRICAIGVRGEHRNVLYAIGFSGHGVTLANLAGRVITDLYAGCPERWAHLPFVQPRLPWIPPEPLRWTGYQMVTALTGKSPRQHG